jgi:hypothetical protein
MNYMKDKNEQCVISNSVKLLNLNEITINKRQG